MLSKIIGWRKAIDSQHSVSYLHVHGLPLLWLTYWSLELYSYSSGTDKLSALPAIITTSIIYPPTLAKNIIRNFSGKT